MANEATTTPAQQQPEPEDDHPGGPPVGVSRTATGGLSLQFALDIPKLPSLRAFPAWTHQQVLNAALVAALTLVVGYLAYDHFGGRGGTTSATSEAASSSLRANVKTSFNPTVEGPVIEPGTYVDPQAAVIGHVVAGTGAYIGPFASIRGDEGQPIIIGAHSNIQDHVVIHALRTFDRGGLVEANFVTVDGASYAVYIGENVSIAHQATVHGPVAIHDGAYVGMKALVFQSTVGKGAIVGPGAIVIGVDVPEGRLVPAGAVITSQEAADALDEVDPSHPLAILAEMDLATHKDLAGAADPGTSAGGPGH